ncbi:hypothetical protein [Streptomyces sp. MK5]|uniref:hypothetical protein n=1 Tax=Streptomyces sp. MK5 TaxID=3064253 RepID=UPI00274132D9|nr:hypothetical protein [Streptomyces sp. MK5]
MRRVGVTAVAVPRTERSARGDPDPLGTLPLTAVLVAVLFGIIENLAHGWDSPGIVVAFTAGALLTALFARHALRSPAPLFDPRVLASPRLRAPPPWAPPAASSACSPSSRTSRTDRPVGRRSSVRR